jgi:hypothetical protein
MGENGDIMALDERSTEGMWGCSCSEMTFPGGSGCIAKGLALKMSPEAEDVSLDNDSTLFACANIEG